MVAVTVAGRAFEIPYGGVVMAQDQAGLWHEGSWNRHGYWIERVHRVFIAESAFDKVAQTGYWLFRDGAAEIVRFDWRYQVGLPQGQRYRVSSPARPGATPVAPSDFAGFLGNLRAWLDIARSTFSLTILPPSRDWHRDLQLDVPIAGAVTMHAHVMEATIDAVYSPATGMITFDPRAAFDLVASDFEGYYAHLAALRDAATGA